MGGGIIVLAKKGPLFVGSLFDVCLFLGVRLSRQNKKNRKKGLFHLSKEKHIAP